MKLQTKAIEFASLAAKACSLDLSLVSLVCYSGKIKIYHAFQIITTSSYYWFLKISFLLGKIQIEYPSGVMRGFFKNAKLFNETYTRLECMPQRCRKSKTKEHRIRLAAKACFLDPNLVFLFAVIGNFRFIMHFRSLRNQTKVCHSFTE